MPTDFPIRDAGQAGIGAMAQSAVLFGMLVVAANVPSTALWPWFMAVPLLCLVALKMCVPAWRVVPTWLSMRGVNLRLVPWTILVTFLTVSMLLLWDSYKTDGFSPAIMRSPVFAHEPALFAAIGFALLNSVMEEVICRGFLYDGLTARFGWKLGLIGQAAIFGVMHKNGIPSGIAGMILATIFGLATGLLRRAEGGLFGCVVTHWAADFTIFLLVARQLRHTT